MAFQEEPPEVSETFLSYKVSAGERLLYEYSEEADTYKDRIYNQKGQIAKLKQENELCFRNLVQQVKENEKLMDEAEKVHKDVVERALEDKFLYMKNSEKEVEVMEWQISEYEDQIKSLEEELSKWRHFKENTYPENNARISEMNSILEEMEKVEKEEELELAVKLRQVEEEIQRKTEVLEEEQKDSLLENLHSYLDPKSLAEIRDNGWLHREISAQRVAYERLLEETSKLETGNLELMDDLLRSSESESRESLTLPVVVDTTRIPSASVGSQTVSGTGRAPLASKDSRKSVSEQQAKLHSQKIQSWEDDSLEPLGLRELRRLRIKGKSPHRQGMSRPQTQHDIRLPPLMGEDGEEHRPESRTRKKTWPVTASMLRAIV